MHNKPHILIFVDFYLPGYRAGGPINSISNLVKMLGDEFEFYIVTRDRDLGDNKPYTNIKHNQWLTVDGAKVSYFAPSDINFNKLKVLIKCQSWSKIYLNSFFSYNFSIKVILLCWLFRFKVPIILATRGEFLPGAVKIKSFKKRIYLFFTRLLGLYNNIIWHISDENELIALRDIFGVIKNYRIVADPVYLENNYFTGGINKVAGECRLVFLARISRIKNLHLCLEILNKLDHSIVFDIYGPIEDKEYWDYCRSLMSRMSKKIKISYCGEVPHEQVYNTLAQYHCLFLPTASENFGYAIFEAFASGRPVLIGNDTPWKQLKAQNIGADINPNDQASFVEEIKYLVAMGQEEFDKVVKACRSFALTNSDVARQKAEQRKIFW
jgi:glycosyltransferase involved in cell wall biosynthesis